MPEPRLTEERLDELLRLPAKGHPHELQAALRQVRGDLKVADEDASTLREQVVGLLHERDAALAASGEQEAK